LNTEGWVLGRLRSTGVLNPAALIDFPVEFYRNTTQDRSALIPRETTKMSLFLLYS
jgi:hypothetical protein